MSLTDPFTGMLPVNPLGKQETVQALRQDAIAELDAINLYQAHLNTIADPQARQVLEHVRDQEKEHLAEFIGAIERLDPVQAERLRTLQESGATVLPHAISEMDQQVAMFDQQVMAYPDMASPMPHAEGLDAPTWAREELARQTLQRNMTKAEYNYALKEGRFDEAGAYRKKLALIDNNIRWLNESFEGGQARSAMIYPFEQPGGITLYHGTNQEFESKDITTGRRMYGVHLTTDKDVAREYGAVKTYTLSPDAKVLDLSDGDLLWEFMQREGILEPEELEDIDLENYVKNGRLFQYDISSRTGLANDVARNAQSLGYDVIRMVDDLGGRGDDVAYVVVRTKVLLPTASAHAELPGESMSEWVSGIGGSPGIVIDPGLARATKCTRIDLGPGRKPLIYSPGIIGALDEGQEVLYCQEGMVEREASPAQLAHLQAMSEAAKTCSVEAKAVTEPREHIEAYFSCLGRELARKHQGGLDG